MANFTLDNGDKVESNISGFTGLIVARADHLHGCNRYMVQPKLTAAQVKLGLGTPDAFWHDEDELKVLEKKVLPRKNNGRGGFASVKM